MSPLNLRSAIIRLASRRADLRPHLLPLLAPPETQGNPALTVPTPTSTTAPVLPVVMQSAPAAAPIIFQSAPAPAPIIMMPGAAPQAPAPALAPTPASGPTFSAPPPTTLTDFGTGVFVTSRTQHGFDIDLAPEMTRMLQLGMTRDQVANWAKLRVQEAFRIKDALYMILIRYQSTFENDEQFRLSLERAIDIWRVTEGTATLTEV